MHRIDQLHILAAGQAGERFIDPRQCPIARLHGGGALLERINTQFHHQLDRLIAILRAIEKELLSRAERRSLKSRWRRERDRAAPSPSAAAPM